jgi:hypothetical protein
VLFAFFGALDVFATSAQNFEKSMGKKQSNGGP